MGHGGVSPGPEELPTMDGILDTVTTEQARFAPLQFASGPLAFGEQSAPRGAAKPPGDDGPVDLDFEALTRPRRQAHAAIAETVLGPLVAMPEHVEPGLAPHQLR